MVPPADKDLSFGRGATLRELLHSPCGVVHMLGICGIGMAGLARLLHDKGWRVTGCDAAPNHLAEWLATLGIEILTGHDPDHLSPDVRWVVRSSAVRPDCVEILRAEQIGLPVFRRGEVLSALLAPTQAVVVAGTHGKTTTTTWITLLLRTAGRQPGWCIGGESEILGTVSMTAPPEHPFVAEGDESDGTLSLYTTEIAVVTNIEPDHLDHFSSIEALEECFLTFARNARRRVVFCADDTRAYRLLGRLANALPYGLSDRAAIRGTDLVQGEGSTSFTLLDHGRVVTRINLPVPGRHNVLNALAAAAVGLELGLSPEQLHAGLETVSLPRRRLERVAECGGVTVFSDYGHHPTEIAAVVHTLQRLPHSRMLAVFQPHRFTRTRQLGRDFPAAFEGIGHLLLTPVYAASESPLKGGSVWDLYVQFRRSGIPRDVRVATSLQQAWAYLRHELREGDILLVLGAGDVEKIAIWAEEAARSPVSGPRPFDTLPDSLLAEIQTQLAVTRIKRDFPLARQTTLGVGGTADLWAEPGSVPDLLALLTWASSARLPVHVIGAGSNTLVSDLGVRGLVLRLSSVCFRQIREENGEVVAGAGWAIEPLLD
ncbi:MAG: UDP-N-acetylmuramate--L-alanine ligase, partial [Kiritimatiellae bacterium]|nr:UDP-N-acetylmuramate--L-alanine ligase [Kiritimatiellia bacterium]